MNLDIIAALRQIAAALTVIGGGKEWYDSRHPDRHSADWEDIAADAVGAF